MVLVVVLVVLLLVVVVAAVSLVGAGCDVSVNCCWWRWFCCHFCGGGDGG